MEDARRYSSSASGWSAASDKTRAMTRRWSVILRPLSTQAFSIRVTACSLMFYLAGRLGEFGGQRKPENQRIRAAGRPGIIAFARADLGKAQSGIKCQGLRVVGSYFQKHGLRAHLLRLGDGSLQQGAPQPPPPRRRSHRQGENLRFAGGRARHHKPIVMMEDECALCTK